MRITEMNITSEEKKALFNELKEFAKEMFENRLGLSLDDVMYTSFGVTAKDMNSKMAISMASMDPKLNMTDTERDMMAKLLENI